MTGRPLALDADYRDPDLADLVRRLGLCRPKTRDEFEWRLQTRLSHGVYQQVVAMRTDLKLTSGNGTAEQLAADDARYCSFLDAHPRACLATLEGRIGYYDRMLPLVYRALSGVPNARILDLGCFCGLTTLYLGRKFPQAEIVGVERLAGVCGVAERLLESSGAANVTFVSADFNDYRPEPPFDAAVSLQALPGYMLPFLPSETPEDYRRGRRLDAEIGDAASPVQIILRALRSIRSLVKNDGLVVFNERVQGPARALVFHAALAHAGFEVLHAHMVDWHMVGQKGDIQTSPIVIARPNAETPPTDESAVIDLYALPAGVADLTDLPIGRSVNWQGMEADANYRGLPGDRDEVVAAAEGKDGRRFHQHMGVMAGRLAYVYLCDTMDRRNLTVARTGDLRPLFKTAMDQLVASQKRGDVVSIDPALDRFEYTLNKRFRRYGP